MKIIDKLLKRERYVPVYMLLGGKLYTNPVNLYELRRTGCSTKDVFEDLYMPCTRTEWRWVWSSKWHRK